MLREIQIKAVKPQSRPVKLSDSHGLYLLVHPNGSKYWRLNYRYGGKYRTLALGVYPDVSLVTARDGAINAKRQLRGGKDPSKEKRGAKIRNQQAAANTLRLVAEEWIDAQRNIWSADHSANVKTSLERNVFPDHGHQPIRDITAPDLLATLRKVEKRGALDIAGRVLQRINAVFRYGIATGRCERNPAADLKGALSKPQRKHFVAVTEKELPDFLDRLSVYDGSLVTTTAIRLLMRTFVRTGELRFAKWPEFDLNTRVWTIPGKRMKGNRQETQPDHIVPLSNQAVTELRELQRVTGRDDYVFPNPRDLHQPMSENCVLQALYRMGLKGKMTGHGFRAVASTILNEQGWDADAIERQLAHIERNKVRKAYHRAEYLDERRRMMQHWSDYLDAVGTGANVKSIRAA